MAVVVFDPAEFRAVFPEFAAASDARLISMFDFAAATLLDNTDGSPVMDPVTRLDLFYLLVAHVVALFGANPTTITNRPPGRLSSATEGSVSTAFEYSMPAGSSMMAWYLQTPYGALFWTATAPYRSALYIANGQSGIGRTLAYGRPRLLLPGGV